MRANSIPMIVGVFLTLALILTNTTACGILGGGTSQPAKPIASITTPANNTTFAVGQSISIGFSAADVKGVAQVELSIDGQPVRVEVVNPPVNSFAAAHTWTPVIPGSHAIEVRAFNIDGEVSDLAQIAVTVLPAVSAAPATPTFTPIPVELTPTPAPIGFAPTFTPLPPPSPSPTSGPTEDQPLVTAVVGLNIRTGPGTVIGIDMIDGKWPIDRKNSGQMPAQRMSDDVDS